MKLHEYRKSDGTFDYERYKAVQEAGNIKKLNSRWVHRHVVAFLSEWLTRNVQPLKAGLCHGTRGGSEQNWFSEMLGIEVLGTEISSTATQFPRTIQWDFHEVKPEWLERTDFIYSNSYDHSYDPAKCFTAWASCLRVGGVMLLEHSEGNTPKHTSELDPFGADWDELSALIDEVGKGHFAVREVINQFPFDIPKHLSGLRILVVQKRLPMAVGAGK